LVADRERKKSETKKIAEALDDHYYYNVKNEPFRLKVAYVGGPQSTETYAHSIESVFVRLGILTELVPLEPKDIDSIISTGKKNYDLIVLGIESPGNIARIGQLFSSNEAGNGVNFSNIQSKTLDNLFETLRSSTLTGVVADTKKQITDFMEKESFFLPLSSPIHTLYVDRNLK
jgi:ABC-type transport system substrate-binding protein